MSSLSRPTQCGDMRAAGASSYHLTAQKPALSAGDRAAANTVVQGDYLLALERLIGEVSDLQSKLILLVGNNGKTRLLRALARRFNTMPLNVGVKLGRRLAATPATDRGFSTNELLREITADVRDGAPLLLDNIEVLFEPSLNINPLNVVKFMAHARLVIAAWPGELLNDRLIYASMGHSEYRDYTRDGVVVFETAQRYQWAGRSNA